MRIIITRPIDDSRAMARDLEVAGHDVIIAPLMHVEFLPLEGLGGPIIQALVATSRNAIRALMNDANGASLTDLPLFAVGRGTADAAHTFGFHGIIEGPGTAEGLAGAIVANANPAGGRLVQIAGEHLAFDLRVALLEHRFNLEVITGYRTVGAKRLPENARTAIANHEADAVILMSPRSASIYVAAVAADDLLNGSVLPKYLCLSEAVAAPLREAGLNAVDIAKKPNGQEMLALVNRIAAQSGP